MLSSLPTNHPQVEILAAFGPSLIVRLSIDPIRLPSDIMERSVIVDWLPRFVADRQELTRLVSWADLPKEQLDKVLKWPSTMNAQDITEGAAIGMMALLVHDLEQASINTVLQIGNSGDYLLTISGGLIQAECSGIAIDPNGYLLSRRLKDKCDQVLRKDERGFAAVTAFSYSQDKLVRSSLHYCSRQQKKTHRRKPK